VVVEQSNHKYMDCMSCPFVRKEHKELLDKLIMCELSRFGGRGAEMVLVQDLKIRERSNDWWDAAGKLIGVQYPVGWYANRIHVRNQHHLMCTFMDQMHKGGGGREGRREREREREGDSLPYCAYKTFRFVSDSKLDGMEPES